MKEKSGRMVDDSYHKLFRLLITLRRLGLYAPLLSHSEIFSYAAKWVVR